MENQSEASRGSVLQFAGFRNLWVGQLISQFGDTLHMLVFLWLVLEITGNPASVGIVGAFGSLPYVLFSVAAGVLADRCDRRWILLLSDLFSAALALGFLGILLLNPKPSLFLICLFGFALSSVNVVAAPARNAAIPRLVPETRLMEANTLNSTAQNTMPLIGNVMSALVLKALFVFNRSLAYLLTFGFNALTFLISAFFMARLPKLIPERETNHASPWHDISEGWHFVWKHRVLAPAMLASLGMNFFVAPYMPTFVVITQQRFKGTPAMLALMDAGFFLGMLAGSLSLLRIPVRRVGWAFSGFLMLAGMAVLPMGYVPNPWLFGLLNFVCGIFIPPASVPLSTLIQSETPDGMRGRVNAALGMISALVVPVGVALSGLLLRLLGIEGTFLFMGFGLIFCPLLALLARDFRHARLPANNTGNADREPI